MYVREKILNSKLVLEPKILCRPWNYCTQWLLIMFLEIDIIFTTSWIWFLLCKMISKWFHVIWQMQLAVPQCESRFLTSSKMLVYLFGLICYLLAVFMLWWGACILNRSDMIECNKSSRSPLDPMFQCFVPELCMYVNIFLLGNGAAISINSVYI